MNTAAAINTAKSTSERRGRDSAHPERLDKMLTFDQSVTLNTKSQFGWHVAFVRRPLFQPVEVVITNPAQAQYMIIDEDGSTRPFFNVRTDDFE